MHPFIHLLLLTRQIGCLWLLTRFDGLALDQREINALATSTDIGRRG
jgi:hypothetical protein